MSTVIQSFNAIYQRDATRLILGSMPGQASLDANQYYAHPRNAFWPIIEALYAKQHTLDYTARCQLLRDHQIALWDVLQACIRPGSLDTSIDKHSIVTNDFATLLHHCPHIHTIHFNGSKAEQLFVKHVSPTLATTHPHINLQRLPSTSPAHAAMGFEKKLMVWREALIHTP